VLAIPLLALSMAAAAQASDRLPARVRDLHYGDVLFHFYQGDHVGALVRLQAAQHFDRLEHHAIEARLLEGGLYLSLGQHEQAGRIFEAMFDGTAEPAVRDRAWFYLAKVWYQRDYLDRAARALASIGSTCPPGRLPGSG
jgi:tetratricopeptide (TPR) repeat protein